MGHYDDQEQSLMEQLRQKFKDDVLNEHYRTKNYGGTEVDHLKAAVEFLLEAYGDHTRNHNEKITAHVHLGRIRGTLI